MAVLDILTVSKIFTSNEEKMIHLMKSKAKEVAKDIVSKFDFVSPTFASRVNHGNVIIAGGCFVSWYNFHPPNDIDVFILDDYDTKMAFDLYADHAMNTARNSIASPVKDKSDYIRSNKKITKVVEEHDQKHVGRKYQYIHTDYKTRRELLDHFDFIHTTVSYNIGEDKLYITREAFDCIKKKELKINNGNEPEQWRTEKFVRKGWSVFLGDKFDKNLMQWERAHDELDSVAILSITGYNAKELSDKLVISKQRYSTLT